MFGFIKQSKGHIKIYSEVGHVTSVKLYLPRHVTVGPQTSPGRTADAIAPCSTGSETIPTVEDENEVRQTSVAALQELGYQTLAAGHAHDALAIIMANPNIDVLPTL